MENKKLITLILAIFGILTVVFGTLTVVTFFSEDYVRASDKVEYLESEYDDARNDWYDHPSSDYFSEKKRDAAEYLEDAKEELKPIETRGIIFALITGCSLLVLIAFVIFVKFKKLNKKES